MMTKTPKARKGGVSTNKKEGRKEKPNKPESRTAAEHRAALEQLLDDAVMVMEKKKAD